MKKGLKGSFAGIRGTNKNENNKYKKPISPTKTSSSSTMKSSSSQSETRRSSTSTYSSNVNSNKSNDEKKSNKNNLYNNTSPSARIFWETYKDSNIWTEVNNYDDDNDVKSNTVKQSKRYYNEDNDVDANEDDDDDESYYYRKDSFKNTETNNDKIIGRGDGSLTSLKVKNKEIKLNRAYNSSYWHCIYFNYYTVESDYLTITNIILFSYF